MSCYLWIGADTQLYLFLNSALDVGVGAQLHAPAALPTEKDTQHPLYQIICKSGGEM